MAGFRIRIDLMRIRIRIQHFFLIADPDPGFDGLKLKKIYSWKFHFYFLDPKLPFIYPKASIKYAQATGEAFNPQKRTSSTSKHENSVPVLFRIQQLKLMRIHADPDPDPKPCFLAARILIY
jgi:hypothetical protein